MPSTLDYICAAAGKQPRPQQIEAFEAACATIDAGGRLLAQLPTGVGKSFVALALAHKYGGVVSTAGNALTAQYLRDCEACLPRGSFVRLIGRSNYVCGGDAEWLESVTAGRPHATRYEAQGDDPRCPGWEECTAGEDGGCGALAAREAAQYANVVLTNHHKLACAGLFIDHLADRKVRIVDECHELAPIIEDLSVVKFTPRTGVNIFRNEQAKFELLNGWFHELLAIAEPLYKGSSSKRLPARFGSLCPSTLQVAAMLSSTHIDDTADEEEASPSQTLVAILDLIKGDAHALITPEGVIEIRHLRVAALTGPACLPGPTVMMSGTIPRSCPTRLGIEDTARLTVHSPFAWQRVVGHICPVSGSKSLSPDQVRANLTARTDWLLAGLANARPLGAMILCPSNTDVRHLTAALRAAGHHVIEQGAGGKGAVEAVAKHKARIEQDLSSVLVGVLSLATGTDLPGRACELVALWSTYPGAIDPYLQEAGGAAWIEDTRRTINAQSIGRLLRSVTDMGSVLVCDGRMRKVLRELQSHHAEGDIMDEHVTRINWT